MAAYLVTSSIDDISTDDMMFFYAVFMSKDDFIDMKFGQCVWNVMLVLFVYITVSESRGRQDVLK